MPDRAFSHRVPSQRPGKGGCGCLFLIGGLAVSLSLGCGSTKYIVVTEPEHKAIVSKETKNALRNDSRWQNLIEQIKQR